jgi:CHASE3 domain sensor protein
MAGMDPDHSSMSAKRLTLSFQELSDQAITALAVIGVFIWALLLICQERNISAVREHSDARSHARETLISLQSYALQVKELAVQAEGYELTGNERYSEQYLTELASLDEQAQELDARFARLENGRDGHRKLLDLVANAKALVRSIMQRPISENAALGARQLMLLYKQQQFISQEEHRIALLLREEIDRQDADLKRYSQRFYVTKHVIMVYSTLLVLVSFALVLRERRIRRRLVSNGHVHG